MESIVHPQSGTTKYLFVEDAIIAAQELANTRGHGVFVHRYPRGKYAGWFELQRAQYVDRYDPERVMAIVEPQDEEMTP
jgi:hypothetical protein